MLYKWDEFRRGERMRKLIIGLLVACLVNIISVKGNSLESKSVYENPAINTRVETNSLMDDDRSRNLRSEKKRLRKEKVKYRKIYRANKKKAREQEELNTAGARVSAGHRDMMETRGVDGM
jgi:hypothetical protein